MNAMMKKYKNTTREDQQQRIKQSKTKGCKDEQNRGDPSCSWWISSFCKIMYFVCTLYPWNCSGGAISIFNSIHNDTAFQFDIVVLETVLLVWYYFFILFRIILHIFYCHFVLNNAAFEHCGFWNCSNGVEFCFILSNSAFDLTLLLIVYYFICIQTIWIWTN